MKIPFENEMTVSLYDTDMAYRATLQNMVKYLMETAVNHSQSTEFTMQRLMEMRRGWVVLNWVIKIYDYPSFSDRLKISTWAKYGNTLQATRYFTMSNEDGASVCEAVSRWALIDLDRRHPTRYTGDMEEAYCCDRPEPFDPCGFDILSEKGAGLISDREIIVRRSETDANGHANNTRYVEWSVDDVPDDIYEAYRAEELRVLYRKECMEGDRITIRTYLKDADDNTKIIITAVTDESGNALCKMSGVWKKK